MKKEYVTPVIEKIIFDYKVQTNGSNCFGSVMNVATSESECGEGSPVYVGWNSPNPGGI